MELRLEDYYDIRPWEAGAAKKKPGYDPKGMMAELMKAVVDIYGTGDGSCDGGHPSLRAISERLECSGYGSISPAKIRKLLITANYQNLTVYNSPVIDGIYVLRRQGCTIDEIAALTGKSKKTVRANLPYEKVVYKLDETPGGDISVGAERARSFKRRKKACENLRRACESGADCGDALWQAVLTFENYPFKTTSGLAFSYTFKNNRRGEKGNELSVSRKEKTITRSSIEVAFDKVMEKGGQLSGQTVLPVKMSTPKELGTFGASYIYPLFIRFGLVEHVGSDRTGRRPSKKGMQYGKIS